MIMKLRQRLCLEQGQCIQPLPLDNFGNIINNKPVHPKGNQPWVVIGGTDGEAEAPIFWPPCVNSRLIGKDPDAGKEWGQEEKGTTEDEIVRCHHWLNGHGFGWTLGVGDGQGGLACCSSWGWKELDMTERLNWTETPTFCLVMQSNLSIFYLS